MVVVCEFILGIFVFGVFKVVGNLFVVVVVVLDVVLDGIFDLVLGVLLLILEEVVVEWWV